VLDLHASCQLRLPLSARRGVARAGLVALRCGPLAAAVTLTAVAATPTSPSTTVAGVPGALPLLARLIVARLVLARSGCLRVLA